MSSITPEEIESWLTMHPDWLKSYILQKVDPNLIYRWLFSRDNHKIVIQTVQSNGGAQHGDHSSREQSPNLSPSQYTQESRSFFSAVSSNRDSQKSAGPTSFLPQDGGHTVASKVDNGGGEGTSPPSFGLSDSCTSGQLRESRGNQRSNSKKYLRQNFARSRIRGLLKAHEPSVSFETDSTLADRRNSLKGMRQFLSLPSSAGTTLSMLIQSKVRMPRRYAGKNEDLKRQLRLQNERDFFLEIVRDISNDLDLNSLIGSILVNVSILVLAERSSICFVEGPRGLQTLVTRTFDVDAGSDKISLVRSDIVTTGSPWGAGIAGYVAESKTLVNLNNPQQDVRYREDMARLSKHATTQVGDTMTVSCGAAAGVFLDSIPCGGVVDGCGSLFRPAGSLLCLPICNTDGEVVAVAHVINKMSSDTRNEFSNDDEKLLETYLAFCGMAISNAQAIEAYRREYDRNKALLEVVHDLFEQQTSVDAVVTKIMQRAQTLLNCERCVVMLEENRDSSASAISEPCRLFDLQQPTSGHIRTTSSSIVFHMDPTTCDKTPTSDDVINLSDHQLESIYAVAHDLIGITTSGILCKPIRNSKFQTIGAAQLINKLGGGQFDENDERLFEAFAIFCGLGINNCLMFDETARAAAKQAVALEVLSYHATVTPEQVQLFKSSLVPSAHQWRIDSAEFDDFSLSSDEMILAGIRIFQDMGLIKRFKIDYETLVRWMLTVRKNYRTVAYHNWRHAFNVCQFMFAVLETCGARKLFGDIECLALIVACLCHDLDHRGTNNAFQQKSSSALSQLYGTQATLEHHHFNHAVMILNSEGHNIFANLNSEDYSQVMNLLKQAILATDLSLHIQVRQKFFSQLSSSGSVRSVDISIDHDVLRSIMMTTCDIAAITKPWDVQLRAADLVIMEFFDQGDKERAVLKIQPLAIMDRERQEELPLLQIEWIDGICLPLYGSLAQMDAQFQPLLDNVVSNRERWQVLHANLDKHLKQTEV